MRGQAVNFNRVLTQTVMLTDLFSRPLCPITAYLYGFVKSFILKMIPCWGKYGRLFHIFIERVVRQDLIYEAPMHPYKSDTKYVSARRSMNFMSQDIREHSHTHRMVWIYIYSFLQTERKPCIERLHISVTEGSLPHVIVDDQLKRK